MTTDGPIQLAATYSIVARDTTTGDLGVAVQSHYFAVGASVSFAEAGVGAVATQAFGEPAYGPRGLELLRDGKTPAEALHMLLTEDDAREMRQVALVDAAGRVAVHTGKVCVAEAGHRTGDGYAAQGNMLRSDGVWDAMAAAIEAASGDLAERLVVALESAELAGGDVRGRQSAALCVVSGQRGDRPWEQMRVDLRVDDHRDPIAELRRLLAIRRANRIFDDAIAALRSADFDRALEYLARARALHPDDPQLQFWTGIVLAYAGRVDEALLSLQAAYAADSGWRELLRRLVPVGIVPNDPELIEKLTRE